MYRRRLRSLSSKSCNIQRLEQLLRCKRCKIRISFCPLLRALSEMISIVIPIIVKLFDVYFTLVEYLSTSFLFLYGCLEMCYNTMFS